MPGEIWTSEQYADRNAVQQGQQHRVADQVQMAFCVIDQVILVVINTRMVMAAPTMTLRWRFVMLTPYSSISIGDRIW